MEMKNKLIICSLLFIVIFSIGCDTKTNRAYFDLDSNLCNISKLETQCDNMCDKSGIRIRAYREHNKVIFQNEKFICRCY